MANKIVSRGKKSTGSQEKTLDLSIVRIDPCEQLIIATGLAHNKV